MALDGDAALALQVHIVEHLPFSNLNGLGALQQTVGQRRLTVVYMCDDAEVADVLHLCNFDFRIFDLRIKMQKYIKNQKSVVFLYFFCNFAA